MTGALAAFLDGVFGDRQPLRVEPMLGGGSCEIFVLERGGQRWVLRRSPARASSPTAHDVIREFRVLDAIKSADVRIARPIASCVDPDVFERPFYVMSHVEGQVVRSSIPPAWAADPAHQDGAFHELVDALAEVHAVDWKSVGLGDLGRPEGFLERQVQRWLGQLDGYGGRDLPEARRLGDWLAAHMPSAQSPTLFHGDYKLDNVVFAASSPPRLLAIVDWEMCSIGDPLIDLAWAMIFHPTPGRGTGFGTGGDPAFDLARVPSAEAMLARYAVRSGRDLSAMRWYHVFARWKLAIVLEGSHAKWRRGESDKAIHAHFGTQADGLLAEAARIA